MNEYEITQTEYIKNIVKMSIIWCTASFSVYLLILLDKYLEGSIFTNFYFEGIGSLCSMLFTYNFYHVLRMRNCLQLALIITITSYFFIMMLEEGVLSPNFMSILVDYPEKHSASDEDRERE